MSIGKQIVDWYETNGRDLPWRKTRDPYAIWISEIILQQTRISVGTAYYERFLAKFPSVRDLAAAPLDDVLKMWEGLGYYSRARNLHAAAQEVVNLYEGTFPDHYTELIKLKGVGPYTSRAIGSFAFGNQAGVIDGNVLRVMSRVLADFSPIDQNKTKKQFQSIIDQWVAPVDSAPFNHGIMDIGSTICTPTKPGCLICPLENHCQGRKEGVTHVLPVKSKKLERPTRYFHFFHETTEDGRFLIHQRPPKGLWGGLWEIPNQETEQDIWEKKQLKGYQFKGTLKHVFTHFDMMIAVHQGQWQERELTDAHRFISPEEISIFAFSKAVSKIFDRFLYP